MADYSTESIQGVVFGTEAEARAHGKGGIWYAWKDGPERRFPEDVRSVWIVMPVNWGESDDPDRAHKGIAMEWSIDHKNHCNAQWSLSGTFSQPTMSPSLNWVTMWHGHLVDGFLRSC